MADSDLITRAEAFWIARNMVLELSEAIARRTHGNALADAALAAFREKSQDDPELANMIWGAPDAWEALIGWHKLVNWHKPDKQG